VMSRVGSIIISFLLVVVAPICVLVLAVGR
jgi:hypothetical protein